MKTGIAIVFFLLPFYIFCQTVNADAVTGCWITGNSKAIIKITKEGNVYNGKIVWLKNPTYEDGKPKIDKHNPDTARRRHPILAMALLQNFKFQNNKWVSGTIYH